MVSMVHIVCLFSLIAILQATDHNITVEYPPNYPDFEDAFTDLPSGPRARGRTGPNSTATIEPTRAATTESAPSITTPSPSVDLNTLLTAALIPLIQRISQDNAPPTDQRHVDVQGHRSSSDIVDVPLPSPDVVVLLHDFLSAFREDSNVDLTSKAVVMAQHGFTPDTLEYIAGPRLSEVLHVVEGKVWQLRSFAGRWVAKQNGKQRQV